MKQVFLILIFILVYSFLACEENTPSGTSPVGYELRGGIILSNSTTKNLRVNRYDIFFAIFGNNITNITYDNFYDDTYFSSTSIDSSDDYESNFFINNYKISIIYRTPAGFEYEYSNTLKDREYVFRTTNINLYDTNDNFLYRITNNLSLIADYQFNLEEGKRKKNDLMIFINLDDSIFTNTLMGTTNE